MRKSELSEYGEEKYKLLLDIRDNSTRAIEEICSDDPDVDGALYEAVSNLRTLCDQFCMDLAAAGTLIKNLWK